MNTRSPFFCESVCAVDTRADAPRGDLAAQMLEKLQRDRYSPGSNPEYRKGWTQAAEHFASWLRLEIGIAELRASDVDGAR